MHRVLSQVNRHTKVTGDIVAHIRRESGTATRRSKHGGSSCQPLSNMRLEWSQVDTGILYPIPIGFRVLNLPVETAGG